MELEQAKAYCTDHGVDFEWLCLKAYPDEDPPSVRDVRLTWNIRRIVDGLTDINWHSLCTEFCILFEYEEE